VPNPPLTVVEFQDTPNPNAIKCVLDRAPAPLEGASVRSYATRAAAAKDPIALALFAIPGVTNVLVGPMWVTVNKSADAEWKSIKPAVKKAISAIG
jgi:hypothetical protein